jgi:hypothetical protein
MYLPKSRCIAGGFPGVSSLFSTAVLERFDISSPDLEKALKPFTIWQKSCDCHNGTRFGALVDQIAFLAKCTAEL